MRHTIQHLVVSILAFLMTIRAEDGSIVPIEETILFRRLEQNQLPCDLECKNGGKCHYIPGTIEELKRYAQTGILVQKCRCPPGFDGVGCEIPVEQCDRTTLTCALSGKPCDKLPDASYTCACHVADAVDRNFAGNACRRWNTEYCAGQLDENADAIYLCTNGGKCQSDFIGAAIAPGDLSVNLQYQDAGCVCNANYYGPHCEFLRFEPKQNIAMRDSIDNKNVPVGLSEETGGSPMRGIVIGLLAGVLAGVLLMMAYRRHKRIKAWKASQERNGFFKDDAEEAQFANSNNAISGFPPLVDDPYMDAVQVQQELVDISLHDEDEDDGYNEDGGAIDPLESPAHPVLCKASSLQEEDDEDEYEKNDEKEDINQEHFFT